MLVSSAIYLIFCFFIKDNKISILINNAIISQNFVVLKVHDEEKIYHTSSVWFVV